MVTRLLLDTHFLIWALDAFERLPNEVRSLVEAAENIVLFSPISIWEIAIKIRLGRTDFAVEPNEIAEAALATGFVELRLGWQSAALVSTLPLHHRDPFDRILVAQAMMESVPLYTADVKLLPYSPLVRML
jgi:PIN domain nuclease of toxin-antitoxin system